MALHFYSSTSVATALSDPILTSGAVVMNVPDVAGDNGWPTSFPFTVAVDYGLSTMELVDVTSKGGLLAGSKRQWNISRGVDGTTAQAHSAGAAIDHCVVARDVSMMGLGVIAYNNAGTLAATSSTEVVGLTVTAALDVSRQYEIYTSEILGQSTVQNDYMNIFIRQSAAGGSVSTSSSLIAQEIISCPVANAIRDGKRVYAFLDAPASGTYQFGFCYARAIGTGNVGPNVASSRPVQIFVKDIGPALGSTSP